MTITLYEYDLCYLVQDFVKFKIIGGGGLGPLLVSATGARSHVAIRKRSGQVWTTQG